MKSETYRPGQYRGSQLALLVVADCVVSGPLLVEIIMGLLGGLPAQQVRGATTVPRAQRPDATLKQSDLETQTEN